MRISFKRNIGRPYHSIARWISLLFVTAIVALIVTLICSGEINPNIWLTLVFPGLAGQSTVATNGADQWDNDDRVTAPVTNFSPLSNTLSVSPLFTRAYQIYGTSNNSLGVPITTAFPSTDGWLQFFTNGALLLPSTQQGQSQGNDASMTTLAQNGVQDTTTGVIRLPLIQTLLSVGSKLPVGGSGSTMTYVDLRKAAATNLMKPVPTNNQVIHTSLPSTIVTMSPQGVFVQGGTREGKAVGHLIPNAFWNYINQPDIAPHSWEKDLGVPLTEALTFTLPVDGQTHHMLIQVFSHEALLLDQDAGETQRGQSQDTAMAQFTRAGTAQHTTGSTPNTEVTPGTVIGQSALQLLPTSVDYLSTVGMPTVVLQAQQVVWSQGNTALSDKPGTGHEVAHVGQHFPLTLLGDTSWIGGVPWYHVQWSVQKNSQKGWVSASALTFNSPGNVPSIASFDVLSANLSTYLTNLGPNA